MPTLVEEKKKEKQNKSQHWHSFPQLETAVGEKLMKFDAELLNKQLSMLTLAM